MGSSSRNVNVAVGISPRVAGYYEELARRLREDHGLEETAASVGNKLSRGTFPATFLLAVMAAIGRESVSLADV